MAKDRAVNQARKKLFAIRAIFIGLWLFFSGIIFLIAILTDINWTRPNLEEFMGRSLHRNVKLGRLHWHFGFRGLTVQTSRILVAEHSGEPFLMAGNCEIGFSFLPLLLGQGSIHHFDLQNALFMAVRTGEQKWNFDDLLIACPEADFVDCHNCHVFVIDRKPVNGGPRFPDTELNEVEIKLHRARTFKPGLVHISFALPTTDKNNPTHFQFSSEFWERDKSWWEKNGHFHLDCEHFSLQNWQALAAVVSADKQNSSWSNLVLSSVISSTQTGKINKLGQSFTKGVFDVNVDADGVPNRKLKIDLKIKARDLAYVDANKAAVSLPEITSSAKLDWATNYCKINKLIVRVPDDNILVNCDAELKKIKDPAEWQTQGQVVALLGDLNKLGSLISLTDMALPNNAAISSKNLPDGKLFCDLKFSRANQKSNYNLEATISDCKISRVYPWLQTIAQQNNSASLSKAAGLLREHLQQKSLEEFCLSNQSKFTGTIIVNSDEGLTLQDCSLSDGAVVWKFSGKADQLGNWSELQFSNKDLQLAQLSKAISNNQRLAQRVTGWLGVNSNCQITLGGKAQVTAKLSQAAKNRGTPNYFTCETILSEADLRLSKPAINIHHLNGAYSADSEQLTLKNIHASTTSGTMNIDGNLPIDRHRPINFHLHANTISFSDLSTILQLFHMDMKFLDRWQLGGTLKEIDLALNGTAIKPSLHLTAIPDDMTFSLPDSQVIMHANSGKITYNNDVLNIDKLNVSSPNSNFVISLAARNLATTAIVDKLSASLTSVDLSELQACFPPTTKPGYFKNLAINMTGPYQTSNLKGKISGNLEYGRHGDQNLHGALELDNVSLNCGIRNLSCHNLKGKIIFAGNDLIYHGITGNINSSSISLDGRLINYQSKIMQWHGESTVQIAPVDLNDALSFLVSSEHVSSIKGRAKKPITLKIKSHIAQNGFSHSFTVLADSDALLHFSYNNFTFRQPAGTKLVISGSCRKDEQQLLWHYLSFDFAGSQIIFKGSLRNNSGPVNVQAQIPEFMEASLLEQSFCPDIIAGMVNGQIKGSINMQGAVDALQYSGKIYLSHVSAPALYLTDMSGDLALQPTTPVGAQTSLLVIVRLKELNLGVAPLSQANGTINYASSAYTLNDFTAQLAGGKLTATGKVDLTQKISSLDLNIQGAELNELWPQITNSQIDMDGPLDCHFSLESAGASTSEMEQNLSGSGTIHVGHGSFNRTGALHARLNQVNLIHQGIFGFNVNNLMQSVVPAKTSGFDSIDGSFGLSKDVLTIRRLLYDSNDLKFSAAGKVNLALHSLELDVAGVMPRVSTSVIHGPLGQLSREITLQKFLDSLTMHKLDKLPSLPLIGGIGSKTDLFTCRIDAPYNQPKLISQSIQRSFQWLNYRQAAAPTKHVQ